MRAFTVAYTLCGHTLSETQKRIAVCGLWCLISVLCLCIAMCNSGLWTDGGESYGGECGAAGVLLTGETARSLHRYDVHLLLTYTPFWRDLGRVVAGVL